MERNLVKSERGNADLLFGGFVVGMAAVIFAAILLWPSSRAATVSTVIVGETSLGQTLSDKTTQNYLNVLYRVKPEIATQLEAEAATAIAGGADHDTLAQLILAAYGDDLQKDVSALFKADIKYVEQITRLTQRGLATAAQHAPKYCKLSNYVRFKYMQPDDIAEEMAELVAYESLTYQYALNFNRLLLEAIEDGQTNPKNYGRLSNEDNQALQKQMVRLMQSRKFSQLAYIQTLSKSEQERAAMNLNVCELATEALAAFNSLPKATKGRLMGEAQRQMKSGKFQRQMRAIQSTI